MIDIDENSPEISQIEEIIGYHFKNKDFLIQSFIHRSYSNELSQKSTMSYERSEFLGDAVLELIVSEYLYHKYPDYAEGKLTKFRSVLVNESTLAYISKEFGLDKYVLLGKGERKTTGRYRESILADVIEALLGGIYLDGGPDAAKKAVRRLFTPILTEEAGFLKKIKNYKSILQEHWQKIHKTQEVHYKVFSEEGPENDKTFHVHCYCAEKLCGTGQGKNKKQAEQEAAKNALEKLGVL